MILEVVQWITKEGHESAFDEQFHKAQDYLSAAEGYISHRFYRCIENPRKFTLHVEWSSLEAHTKLFRRSEAYEKYRALIKPHYEEGAILEHYELT